ncbi:hypothetical protein JYB64_15920 [Algoriphagus aestuarii]|nr:hypothetical protein [Algoriphagus aestuarii]
MKYKLILWGFIIVTFTFCNSKRDPQAIYFQEEDLPEMVFLKGQKFSFSEIMNPYGVFLTNGLALVYEVKNVGDDKFHIIDLENERIIGSKGIDGMGPGEISLISQMEAINGQNKVWTFDPELLIYSKFDLSDTSKLAEEQIKAPQTAHFLTELVWTSDNTLLGNAVDGWTKYLHLTKTGDTLALFGNWKNMIDGNQFPKGINENELDANLISNLFQGPLRASQNKQHFIKVGMNVDYIDIIDLENQDVKTIYGPTQEIQGFQIKYSGGYQMPVYNENKTTRYAGAFAGENSFYVLFRGKPYSQISASGNLNRIFQFDYEGNILNHYQLDFPIFGFAVDEENRAIYGVTVDRDPNLVRFDY